MTSRRILGLAGAAVLLSALQVPTVQAVPQASSAAEPEFKPGIPGLKMADVRDHSHLWKEIEELQTWERGDRISIAEFRDKVIEKTVHFLQLEGTAADRFSQIASDQVQAVRASFKAGRATDLDPSDPGAPFATDVKNAVAVLTGQLEQLPRHQLFAPDFKKWLLRLAFSPSEAKEAREAQQSQLRAADRPE